MKLEKKVHKKAKKESHPAGVRGLKLWGKGTEKRGGCLSHPAGVRGLKHLFPTAESLFGGSHPAGVRGLKRLVTDKQKWC